MADCSPPLCPVAGTCCAASSAGYASSSMCASPPSTALRSRRESVISRDHSTARFPAVRSRRESVISHVRDHSTARVPAVDGSAVAGGSLLCDRRASIRKRRMCAVLLCSPWRCADHRAHDAGEMANRMTHSLTALSVRLTQHIGGGHGSRRRVAAACRMFPAEARRQCFSACGLQYQLAPILERMDSA